MGSFLDNVNYNGMSSFDNKNNPFLSKLKYQYINIKMVRSFMIRLYQYLPFKLTIGSKMNLGEKEKCF